MTTHEAARPIDFSVAHTFGIQAPEKLRVPGFDTPGPLTPTRNDRYRFRPSLLSDLLAWHRGIALGRHHDGLLLTGPMGSGKSSLVVETAARLNLNLVQANGKRRLEIADLIGHHTAIGGDVLFQDGPLTLAARNGWWMLINEFDLVDPGELAGLDTVLDGGPLLIEDNGGEVVHPAMGFGLICTANTVGLGDATGLYAGTRRMNAALLDRFWVVDVDYPETSEEEQVIREAVPGLPGPVVARMVEVANEVRRLFAGDGEEGQQIETTFSTRTLVRWAYLAQQYRGAPKPLEHALERALTNRAEPETAAAIHGIVQRVMGEDQGVTNAA